MKRFWTRDVWRLEQWPAGAPPGLGRILLFACRTLYVVISAFGRERLKLRAASLTYVTLLSLVPALAVAFSLFAAFGGLAQVGRQLEELLIASLVPSQKDIVIEYLQRFVSSANAGSLGAVGTVFLFVAVLFLVADVERAFNDIWGVSRGRNWAQRFQVYWPLITLGPMLVGLSFSMTAAIATSEVVRSVEDAVIGFRLLGRMGALLLTCLFFGFVYHIVPNTTVRWRASLVGGVVGGGLWLVAQELYAAFAANAIMYSAIYGSLSSIPLFIVWIFVSWTVALLGAVVTFAVQSARTYEPDRHVTQYERELVAAQVTLAVAVRFSSEHGPAPSQALIDDANVPPRVAHQVLEVLVEKGVLLEARIETSQELGYVPARPLESMSLWNVIDALRTGEERATGGWDAYGRVAVQVIDGAETEAKRIAEAQSLEALAHQIREDLSDGTTRSSTLLAAASREGVAPEQKPVY